MKTTFSDLFHQWFETTIGTPTEVQQKTWPIIARGQHILLSSPTGSGKTLAACFWALERLLSGDWEPGTVRVIYISPLKSLASDVKKNLRFPLTSLKEFMMNKGVVSPNIHVETRDGDTSAYERTKMRKNPPEILVTTPESLNIMLATESWQINLSGVQCIILDEIHALAGTKRGTLMMAAVELLTLLSGEFQRISLSATVEPIEAIAQFVAGYQRVGSEYKNRKIKKVKSKASKKYDLTIYPIPKKDKNDDEQFWGRMTLLLRNKIEGSSSTIAFTNGRRLTEKVVHFINDGLNEKLAYAHHGSLAKDIRTSIEDRLKNGEITCVVATNSLELGVDIENCEQVLLIQTPKTISSFIQRLGRAGHTVGKVSKGHLFPTHGGDLLEATALGHLVDKKAVEKIIPIKSPLDVLSQIIVQCVLINIDHPQTIFQMIRCIWAYRSLKESIFKLILDLLCGRYQGGKLGEIKPLLQLDSKTDLLSLRKGTRQVYYFNMGVIPDRGYYKIKIKGSDTSIGELDEEFVWENPAGSIFSVGTQNWKVESIFDSHVEVVPQ